MDGLVQDKPGQTRYLKRVVGYTDKLPETEEPGFFWTADPKHVDFLVQWAQKRGSKPAQHPAPRLRVTASTTA